MSEAHQRCCTPECLEVAKLPEEEQKKLRQGIENKAFSQSPKGRFAQCFFKIQTIRRFVKLNYAVLSSVRKHTAQAPYGFKKPDGGYYYEELFGTIGFDGMSSLLYHFIDQHR